jgi:hypothetical protein
MSDVVSRKEPSTMKTKCFSCSNKAIAIANCCSPTSADGVTPDQPRCEECLANMRGANIISLLVSPIEYQKRMSALVKNKHGFYIKAIRESN